MLPPINEECFQLSIEQEFKIRKIEEACEKMSKEDLKNSLISLVKLSEIRINLYRDLLKKF